jgi:hemoglobin
VLAAALPACVAVGDDPPPGGREPFPVPSIALLSPVAGSSVVLAADAERSMPVAFSVTGMTLRPPGTCLASEQPCGHVLLEVDGDACDAPGASWNSVAAASPARLRLSYCPAAEGAHTLRASLAWDDRSPVLSAAGNEVSASLAFSAEIGALYDRLGGAAGIAGLSHDFLFLGLARDARVNWNFLNDSNDLYHFNDCFVKQIGALAGGPETYDCLDMASAHAGRGISASDMADFLEILRDTALSRGIASADADELLAALGAAAKGGVVEDPTDDASLYQRLGRRPGIEAAVAEFGNRLIADPSIAGFFAEAGQPPDYGDRTALCIARLVCSVGGPCVYGGEATALEEGLQGEPCRSMAETHAGMTSPQDDASGIPIEIEHFLAVATHLDGTLGDLGVSEADRALVLSALAPTCPDILADPAQCGGGE